MKTVRFLVWSLVMIATVPVLISAQTTSPVKVDEPAVCFECHDNVQVELKAPHVHTAIKGGKCSDCHNPHASKHATLLYESAGELCLTCHDEIAEAIVKPFPHLPAQEKGCTDCHNPHASTHPNQLTSSIKSLCSTCHDQVVTWEKKVVVHGPVADGDCATCHNPHGGTVDGLLVEDVPKLCLGCHEPDAKFNAKHSSSEIQHADCRTCHDPHATNNKNLLRSNQHAPFAAGNCSACHETAGSGTTAFAVKNKPEKLCKMCHRDIGKAETTTMTVYRHSAERESYCIDCHNPHTSDVDNILAATQNVLCFRCHFSGPPYEKEQKDYVTHPKLDCTACHTLHVADNEKFLKSTGSELCSGCHQRAHAVSHPMGEDVIDPRNGTSMTCLNCHQMHGSDYQFYLPLDPQRALCIQCHKR